ncbi:MAG: GDSL-type esterase/lipase family protein [Bacteroidales bacterium]|nr:GDSL-type esterase/lipase family protein [Bacteroidales bacterium]
MRFGLLTLLLFTFLNNSNAQKIKIWETVHFLALGDSYTIGQSVAANECWPNQFVFALSYQGYNVEETKIIAQTGWRTDNLKLAISQQQSLTGYNLVSLLIGVNNQYQGGSIQDYATEFEELLKAAIALAGNLPEHVFVLSIPDYAYTPFGKGDLNISTQIDQFNAFNRQITENYRVKYIDITPISRNGLIMTDLVASDGLHPSGKMYALWVQEILKSVEKELGINEELSGKDDFRYILSQRQLTIKSPKEAELFIYNPNGKIVHSQFLQTGIESTINLSGLPAGMYFLGFYKQRKVLYRTKIILI